MPANCGFTKQFERRRIIVRNSVALFQLLSQHDHRRGITIIGRTAKVGDQFVIRTSARKNFNCTFCSMLIG